MSKNEFGIPMRKRWWLWGKMVIDFKAIAHDEKWNEWYYQQSPHMRPKTIRRQE